MTARDVGRVDPEHPAGNEAIAVQHDQAVYRAHEFSVATRWIETEERIIEREILRDVNQQMNALRADIVALRGELILARERSPFVPDGPVVPEPARQD